MKFQKNDKYIVAGVILFLLTFFLLGINGFYLNWSDSTFNNVITPIISVAAAIVLIQTLRQGQEQHKEAVAINQYNILLDDIKALQKEFEALRFDLPEDLFEELRI